MNRKLFIFFCIILPAVAIVLQAQSSDTLAFVLRGGLSYIEGRWGEYDVGVTSAGRLIISSKPLQCNRVIRVDNLVVSPGFIDILADNSANPKQTYRVFEKYKLTDGVTTVLQMHGGATDANEFYDYFDAQPHVVNYGVSTKVMNIRHAAPSRIQQMKMIRKSLQGGALGVSHSIEYQSNTTWDELLDYARIAVAFGRPFFLHTRYSSRERELDGVDEAIRLARETGCHIHIDHLNSTGGTFHTVEALARIRKAREEGLSITTCVYPYSYWATYLSSERFNGNWQLRYGIAYEDIEIVGTGERLTRETFAQYRTRAGLLVAVKEGVQPLAETVRPVMMENFTMIGSDGGIEKEPRANNHPRGAGCFASAIRYGVDEKIPLERILEMMTIRPARLIGAPMAERGELKTGYWADITVFDPTLISSRATNSNPNQFSAGIFMVIVNGKIAYSNGELTSKNCGKKIFFNKDVTQAKKP